MAPKTRAARRGADSVVTVSSNTLFHFTNSYDRLKSILELEFEPRFCLEHSPTRDDGSPFEYAVPMVCFCDLPLSQTSTHLAFYGNYGLGLSKEWGQAHGVTPVLYAYAGSAVRANLGKLWRSFKKDEWPLELSRAVGQILCYIKPYTGRFWRNGKYIEDVRFYNEREWRFVPENIGDKGWMIPKSDYLDKAKVGQLNDAVAAEGRLSFEPRDIRYIIVASEAEVLTMVDDVLRIKGKKYSYDDLRLLTTRIISAQQIREDF